MLRVDGTREIDQSVGLNMFLTQRGYYPHSETTAILLSAAAYTQVAITMSRAQSYSTNNVPCRQHPSKV